MHHRSQHRTSLAPDKLPAALIQCGWFIRNHIKIFTAKGAKHAKVY